MAKRPRLAWENNNPIPSSSRSGYRTSWNFMPCEEKKRTVEMFTVMRTGALNMYGMQDFMRNERNLQREKLVRKWERIKLLRKMSQLGRKDND
tara:strand:+ start:340 stop:618 length:279 start_codon:yes stop_codon:yes gene_type:complete